VNTDMADTLEETKKVKGRGEPARKVGGMRMKDVKAAPHKATTPTAPAPTPDTTPTTDESKPHSETDSSVVDQEAKGAQEIVATSTEVLQEKLAKKYSAKETAKAHDFNDFHLPTLEPKHSEFAPTKTRCVQQPKALLWTH